MGTWYLGPVGALTEIPAPASGLDASPELIGGAYRSLNGQVTVDRLAQPRSWPMRWEALTEDQSTYLRLVGLGLIRGPLRLVDPEQRNRLPVEAASGGSYSRTADAFTQTGGSTPTWVAVTDPPTTAPVRGAISWERTTTGAASLTTTNDEDRVPVVEAEELRASIWVRGAAIDAAAAIDAWDSADSATRTTGTAATLSTTTWTQLTVTYTVASGRVSVTPVLVVASGQTASTLSVTGWQISLSSEATTWTVGGGTPTVVAGSELTDTYVLTGLRGVGLLLLEAV